MTHAIVLIQCERTEIPNLGATLAGVEGVAEAYSVTGDWDFVAIVRVPRHELRPDIYPPPDSDRQSEGQGATVS